MHVQDHVIESIAEYPFVIVEEPLPVGLVRFNPCEAIVKLCELFLASDVSAGLRGIHFRHFTLSHLSERLVWGTPTH